MLMGGFIYSEECLWGNCLGDKQVLVTSSNRSHKEKALKEMLVLTVNHLFPKYLLCLRLLNLSDQSLYTGRNENPPHTGGRK
jgi:hypothetical protein